jgi:hypothetical protein
MYADRDLSLDTFETPDASFYHEESMCDCPGVVVEVSSKWEPKDLEKLAEPYTEGSGGSINCVLGFDIDAGSEGVDIDTDEEEELEGALLHGTLRANKTDKTATTSDKHMANRHHGHPL